MAASVYHHGLTIDRVIALSDDELVRQINEWISRVDDDNVSDALYFLTTEACERLAPEAEWAEHERYYREEYDGDPTAELAATRRAMRSHEAARMIRQAFGEEA